MWEHGPGLVMEAPSLGLPSPLLLEIQRDAKGNRPGVPCLFYIPELQHKYGLCTPKLHNTEKMRQFEDFFPLRYATRLFCAPQMGKK